MLPQSLGSLHAPPLKFVDVLVNVDPLAPPMKGMLESEETFPHLQHSNVALIPFVTKLYFSVCSSVPYVQEV